MSHAHLTGRSGASGPLELVAGDEGISVSLLHLPPGVELSVAYQPHDSTAITGHSLLQGPQAPAAVGSMLEDMLFAPSLCAVDEFASKIQREGYSSCPAIELAKVAQADLLASLSSSAALGSWSHAQVLNSCSCREAAGGWIEGRAFLPGGGLQECSAAGAENVDESLPRLNCHRVRLCHTPAVANHFHS